MQVSMDQPLVKQRSKGKVYLLRCFTKTHPILSRKCDAYGADQKLLFRNDNIDGKMLAFSKISENNFNNLK